jgi:DNA-binding SARP family transcriptional activator
MTAEKVQIFLFGKPSVQIGEKSIDQFNALKVLELFCYLLLHRDRPQLRDVLCEILWSDAPDGRTKKYLRQTLWQLHALLNVQSTPGEMALIQADSTWVRLSDRAVYWLDVAEFEQAYEQTRSIPGRELDLNGAQTLDSASQLYRGDLMEGWYQDWCIFDRERLQNIYISILDKLVEYNLYHQEYEHGIEIGTQILRCDYAHERTYQHLMLLYYLSGDRTTALRQYQRCVAVLQSELGVQPSHQTIACYKQIQADQRDGLLEVEPADQPAARPHRLENLFERIQQLKVMLEDIQAEMLKEIRHLRNS